MAMLLETVKEQAVNTDVVLDVAIGLILKFLNVIRRHIVGQELLHHQARWTLHTVEKCKIHIL